MTTIKDYLGRNVVLAHVVNYSDIKEVKVTGGKSKEAKVERTVYNWEINAIGYPTRSIDYTERELAAVDHHLFVCAIQSIHENK